MPRDINDNQPGLTENHKKAAELRDTRTEQDRAVTREYGCSMLDTELTHGHSFQIS